MTTPLKRICLLGLLTVVAVSATVALSQAQHRIAPRRRPRHVPEVTDLLNRLTVDTPRTHKNMLVFPIRWAGTQAGGRWQTMDQAVAEDVLKISEKNSANVPEIVVRNTGDKTVFLMSGEIVKGGKQTRVIRKDTVTEAKQTVTVAVFCVERGRWSGGGQFRVSTNAAPATVRDSINRGAGQRRVWEQARKMRHSTGASTPTESLDESLDSRKAREAVKAAKTDLGHFSPPDTIGIAIADLRTGRVVGLELFARRDLFANLQEKLIQGYTMDLVFGKRWDRQQAKAVTKADVRAFIRRALAGTSKYEDTAGSGKGIDLQSGTLKGKGIAFNEKALHLSIQDARPKTTPARPIVQPIRRPRTLQR